MIKKIVKINNLDDFNQNQSDLNYWLSGPAEKRTEAVEILRKQNYGNSARLQRTVVIVQLSQS